MWINPEDVRGRWLDGQLDTTDEQLEQLITDAEDIILASVPDVPRRLEDGSLPISRVVRVGVQAIHRKLRNPEGVRSTMETAGAFTLQRTHGGNEPGSMYLTGDELNELRGNRGKRKVTSVKMIGG